jgi:hypothetical protein
MAIKLTSIVFIMSLFEGIKGSKDWSFPGPVFHGEGYLRGTW